MKEVLKARDTFYVEKAYWFSSGMHTLETSYYLETSYCLAFLGLVSRKPRYSLNRPVELLLFTGKIEVSIVFHLT